MAIPHSPRLAFGVVFLLACSEPPIAGDDELGTTTATDFDSDSDSDSTSDSTTGEPEFAACEFEWVTHVPTAQGTTSQVYFAPLQLAADELAIAHQAGLAIAIDTRITRLARTDGGVVDSHLLALSPTAKDYPQSLAQLPEGDYLLGYTNYEIDGAHVARVSAAGEVGWTVADNEHVVSFLVLGLGLRPRGEVVALMTRQVGLDDNDLALVGYAPESGAVLWTHTFGGNAMGESLDRGGALDIADDGRLFVGMSEWVDASTIAPVVVGFGSGEPPAANWSTLLLDRPGETIYAIALDHGPTDLVVAGVQDEDGRFWITGLDAGTGEQRWQVDRDELDLPPLEASELGTLAVSSERVLVAGSWSTTIAGESISQGFVLEFDLDGNLLCHAAIDDRDPETGAFEYAWEFRDAAVGGAREFYLSGFRIPYWNTQLDIDLLAAKVH